MQAHESGTLDLDFFRPGPAFLDSPSISVDYAVMEKTDRAMVVPGRFDWSDVGSWSAIWESSEQDESGNHFSGDVLSLDAGDSYVMAQDRLVGTVGVQNLVVVETADAVLIADKDRVQDVSQIVERLKQGRRDEYLAASGSVSALGQL